VRTLIFAGLLLLLLARPAAAATVVAFPPPGTRTASPETQLSFRGVTTLGTISVRGSRSGRHSGVVRAHSDGRGVSFEPRRPFRQGERVSVRTTLDIAGARDGDFGLTIAREPPGGVPRPGEDPTIGRGAVQRFASAPGLTPPALAVTTLKPGVAPGLVFLAPKSGRGQDGPMIVDDRGRLVWFEPTTGGELAADFRVQSYRGQPVLTWWHGRQLMGQGTGADVIYDSSYRKVADVRAGNGYSADLHEFLITPQDTALIPIYAPVRRDLRSVGGPRNGVAVDNIVQEVDIATGLVLFEWHSLGTVGLAESKTRPAKERGVPWDYFHVNSIALDGAGNIVISARNTWAVYKLGRRTGALLWRLGGTRSDFRLGPGVRFAWQHDAVPQPDGSLSLYDNGATPKVRARSRAISVVLSGRTATLRSAITHPRGLLSATQGDAQRLPNGNTFVGFGSRRYFSEFGPRGELLFDGHLAKGNDSYRAYRFPWTGTPGGPPRIAAVTRGGRTTAGASWNGATGVARWELLGGPRKDAMTVLASAPSSGFETAVTVPAVGFVAMRALDAAGNRLASTAAVAPGTASRHR
jgi:hypothetical protein